MSKPKAAKAELPLRGFLICPDCKSNLTGSGSRGKSGRKFFYYHCQRKCKHRVSAPLANQCFEEWLDELSIK